MIDRRTAWIVVAALAVGWWLGSSPASPVNPNPQRPVLQALARVARSAARVGLWLALAAESPPASADERQKLAGHVYDEKGHQIVDHSEGW